MPEIIPNWHPIFVHFTVALLALSVGLFVATPFMRPPLKAQWKIVACWTLWFGAGFTIITGLTGLYAYNTVAHDTPSHAAMTDHRNWAIAAITLFLTLAVWSILRLRRKRVLGPLFVVGIVFAGGVLASTAWRGGEVVYRYGVGVMSLPQAEGEAHEHADIIGHSVGSQEVREQHPHDDSAHGHDPAHTVGPTMADTVMARQSPSCVPERSDHHDDDHEH